MGSPNSSRVGTPKSTPRLWRWSRNLPARSSPTMSGWWRTALPGTALAAAGGGGTYARGGRHPERRPHPVSAAAAAACPPSTRSLASRHDHATRRIAHHVIRDGAKDRPLQSASATGAKHDCLRRQLFREVADRCAGIAPHHANLGPADVKFRSCQPNYRIRTLGGFRHLLVVLLGIHVRSGVSGADERSRVRCGRHGHEYQIIGAAEQIESQRQGIE